MKNSLLKSDTVWTKWLLTSQPCHFCHWLPGSSICFPYIRSLHYSLHQDITALLHQRSWSEITCRRSEPSGSCRWRLDKEPQSTYTASSCPVVAAQHTKPSPDKSVGPRGWLTVETATRNPRNCLILNKHTNTHGASWVICVQLSLNRLKCRPRQVAVVEPIALGWFSFWIGKLKGTMWEDSTGPSSESGKIKIYCSVKAECKKHWIVSPITKRDLIH